MDMKHTIVDFMRHGTPEGGSIYRGNAIDDPLSATGWQQMWDAVGGQCPWARIISSPLQRCRAFAQTLADRHALPLEIDARFREVGFGAWEGQSRALVKQQRQAEYQAFYRDPVHQRPPGAEPLPEFVARVGAAFDDSTRNHAGDHLLVVAHAGVIRAALVHVLQIPLSHAYRLDVHNAGITRLRHTEFGFALVFHNQTRL